MNVKECVIFTSHFVPPQEFKEFYEWRDSITAILYRWRTK